MRVGAVRAHVDIHSGRQKQVYVRIEALKYIKRTIFVSTDTTIIRANVWTSTEGRRRVKIMTK